RGAAGEVVVAGGDLGGRGIDRIAAAADLVDDLGQALDGAVGVVAHGGEHAVVIAVHARGQVAVGQRGQYLRYLLQARRIGVEQAVELFGELQVEPLLAVEADALGQIATGGRLDHAAQFDLHVHLLGAVAQFDHIAQQVAVAVLDARHALAEVCGAHRDLALVDAAGFDQGLAELFRLGLVGIDPGADELVELELRQRRTDLVLVLLQQCGDRGVGIDDRALRVGDHHAGAGAVQRGADAQVLAGDRLIAFDALAQVVLHAAHGLEQVADLVGAGGVDVAVELAAG